MTIRAEILPAFQRRRLHAMSFGQSVYNHEKAVNHSEHDEHNGKIMACNVFMFHPLCEPLNPEKLSTPRVFASQQLFAVPAVSPWFELRFLG
ncbi:hypothetical protein [Propionivibrio sp.]|uniref:hypothetical protein n=1 Tax=Propionivibrio sp. TaxID=2212460 RepID=UPI003BF4576E